MKLLVRTNEELKEELLAQSISEGVQFEWRKNFSSDDFTTDADAILDLLFENTKFEVDILCQFFQKPIIVNSVNHTLQEIGNPFIRINAWPSFLKRNITEAVDNKLTDRQQLETIFTALGRKIDWQPDEVGFFSARILSMIINEAYFALSENLSSKEEIDIAMKWGTNYPFGPFEWSEKIGLQNIHTLLKKLSVTENRYQPASLLTEKANRK